MSLRPRLAVLFLSLAVASLTLSQVQTAKPEPAAGKPGVLSPEEVKAVLPETVFFRGQKAPVQARNSGGIRFDQGKLVLVTLVDTSGYSTGIVEKYQAYLITEAKLRVGDRELTPGAYGCGMVGGKFLVMDVAANEVLSVPEQVDEQLKRPRPLYLVTNGDQYRLYFGKKFVTLAAAQ